MADALQFDLCPETGIGCLMVEQGSKVLKIDLMPDEAASLRDLVKSGDLEGARALLSDIDPGAETAMGDAQLRALAEEMS